MNTRLALCDVRGPLTDLLEKLSGEAGELWSTALNRMLRKENPWDVACRDFLVFRAVKIGLHKDAAAVTKSLTKAGCQISKWAADIMTKPEFTLGQTESDDELVVVSNAELGFPEGTTFENTCRRALEFGLDLCAAEDGPALRGSYLDQPLNEELVVAMEPITDSAGVLRVFDVERDGDGLWLITTGGNPQRFWDGRYRFVFRRRK